jgi:protein gp37
MADHSRIEWTETTWNPVTGCDRVSAGCDHRYALTLSKRQGDGLGSTVVTRCQPVERSDLGVGRGSRS